jgi:hypothetical protein
MLRDLLLENAEIISAKHMHATLIHTPIVTYLAGFVQERLATSQHCSALGAAVPVELSAVTHSCRPNDEGGHGEVEADHIFGS